MGHIASEGCKTIGEHRSPQECIQAALTANQPGMSSCGLPAPMLEAVKFSTSHSLEHVGRCRSEAMGHFVAKAKELAGEERVLKNSLFEKRREVLSSNRLLLFKWLLDKSEFTDANLFEDLCKGFDLTGTLPSSHTFFSKRFKPAHLPTDVVRGVAQKARSALLAGVRSSGNASVDEEVYKATMKEIEGASYEAQLIPHLCQRALP